MAKVVAGRERSWVETVRRWILQSELDAGARPGTMSACQSEIEALKAKVRQLEQDYVMLTQTSRPRAVCSLRAVGLTWGNPRQYLRGEGSGAASVANREAADAVA